MKPSSTLSILIGATIFFRFGVMANSQDATFEVVLEGLNNPTSVAVQPGTGVVFVAESGAQRVIRVVDGQAEEVITGFPKDVYGKGPLYDIGPLSLLFIDQDTLMVGGGGMPAGEDTIALYKVAEVGADAITADDIEGEAKSLPATDTQPGEGDFYGLVRTGKGVFVTCNGDDEKGWIGLATLEDGKLKDFTRSIATKEETKVSGPVAITYSPDGFLAIGQMGSIRNEGDSLLTFCDPDDGEILATFPTGLNDITGLAYGPQRGRLFATEFNWKDKSKGALVKLVGAGDKCNARKVIDLEKPTALVFARSGDLYVTLAGNTSEGAETPDGKLIMIKGLDDDPAQPSTNK
jgi:DNA-binding beta-propeller fold protein YncE